jgi:hypothetical protein
MKFQYLSSKEEKFRESMKEWDNETRPFMRTFIDEKRDEFDYSRKYERIRKIKEEMLLHYPDAHMDDFQVYNIHGCISHKGDIFTGRIITREENSWLTKNGLKRKPSVL